MSEIALAGCRKIRLQRMSEQGDKRAAMVLKLKENPGYFFSVVQVGINAVAILGGVVGEDVFTSAFMKLFEGSSMPHSAALAISVFCSVALVTMLFVMFSDLIPKRISMSRPEAVAVKMIRPMLVLIVILKPVAWVLTGISNAILKAMKIPLNNRESITNEDLMATVEEGAKAGIIAPIEHTAITNMMDLESHLVPSAMTARDSIVYFLLDDTLDTVQKRIVEDPHDKYLVCDKDIDHIVGILDTKKLLQHYENRSSFTLRDPKLVHEAVTIPDSLTLTETLELFKDHGIDFAVVINEYGLTVGIISLRDIIWLIMGSSSTNPEEAQMVRTDEDTWMVEGATPVDDIERQFGIKSMPEEETYETVAGFMMYMLRRVPKLGDHVEYGGLRFEVSSMDGYHIDQLKLTKLRSKEAAAETKPNRPDDRMLIEKFFETSSHRQDGKGEAGKDAGRDGAKK
ncbi:MAG: HlyC/CorC family transporter [Burkholderia sp.]|jgi:CBS domain containing-hemolysin-like protein